MLTKTKSSLKILLLILTVSLCCLAVVDFHSRSIESEYFNNISRALGELQDFSIMGHQPEGLVVKVSFCSQADRPGRTDCCHDFLAQSLPSLLQNTQA